MKGWREQSTDAVELLLVLVALLSISVVSCQMVGLALNTYEDEDLPPPFFLPMILTYFCFGGFVGGIVGQLTMRTRLGLYSGVLIGGALLLVLACSAALT